jgi:2-polyprenyl-6-hydroxyphenyl methylase/3-demethylubiquinone-9 3-methyltransferase
MKSKNDLEFAIELHEQVPANWYYQSIKIDPFQRFWHKRRFEEVSKLIEPVNGKVLDIGCADGMFSKVILDKSQAKKLIGIDVLETSVSWANKHWRGKMKFFLGDAQHLNFKNNSFDAVFCLEVLEHVQNPLRVLKEIKRIIRGGGYGIFLVPTDNFLFRLIWFLWLHFYPRGWVWKETHIQTYRNNYLTRLCKKAGFKIEEDKKFILGMLQVIKVRK